MRYYPILGNTSRVNGLPGVLQGVLMYTLYRSIYINKVRGLHKGARMVRKEQRPSKQTALLTLPGYPNYGGDALSWSPKGTHLASAYAESVIQTWKPFQEKAPTQVYAYAHKGRLNACSPDGKCIATAHADSIGIWDVTTGSSLSFYRHGSSVENVAWSLDGQRFASVGEYGPLVIWDVATGESHPTIDPIQGGGDGVSTLAWSQDNVHLFSTSGYDMGVLQVWDTRTGRCIHTYCNHETEALEGATALACSPDGAYLLSGHHDGTVLLWSLSTLVPLQTYRWHSRQVTALAWSPDGVQMISGSSQALIISHVLSGDLLHTYESNCDTAHALVWSKNGAEITCVSTRQSICVWDVPVGEKCLQYRGHPAGVCALSWSPDGNHIASAGEREATIQVWNAQTGEPVSARREQTRPAFSLPRNVLSWSPDGATITYERVTWDRKTGRTLFTFNQSNEFRGALWSPNKKYIAVVNGKRIDIYFAKTRKYLLTFDQHASPVQEVAWSADGERLASVSESFPILIWEAKTGKRLQGYSLSTNWPYTIDWSWDNAYIACGGQAPFVDLLDATNGDLLCSYEGHTSSITVVRFSPQKAWIASGSRDCSIRVWQIPPSGSDVTW